MISVERALVTGHRVAVAGARVDLQEVGVYAHPLEEGVAQGVAHQGGLRVQGAQSSLGALSFPGARGVLGVRRVQADLAVGQI